MLTETMECLKHRVEGKDADFMQDIGSSEVGLIYELATTEQRKALMNDLMCNIFEGKPAHPWKHIDEESLRRRIYQAFPVSVSDVDEFRVHMRMALVYLKHPNLTLYKCYLPLGIIFVIEVPRAPSE
ncbi:unnamed protein product [Cylicocyclus nassatus]|uniref:Uncharacterized protein n=1 Tax=Cylicocyclus nassatus TaxID=53992 RepID=A0AA36H1X6_CYLNA|nr:unnamed protein product [Cylicocyclus nassatus]